MKKLNLISSLVIGMCGLVLATNAQAEIKERTFRFATAVQNGHPIVAGAEKFGEIIKQKSGGKMTLKVFPGAVLGGDVQVLSAVQGGTVDFSSMNSGILQSQIKEFAIVDFPFLFNDSKEADIVMDGPVGKQLADKLPEKGLVHLAYYELGFRNLTNSKRPVTKYEDISGLKIRVIQSPIYLDTFSALGANPVPMPLPEVYIAMETKTIDGHENPFTVIETSKFNEVQKYLSITQHIYNPQTFMCSKKTWDSLSKEEQEIISAAAKESAVFQRKVTREVMDKSLSTLRKTMTVNTVSPDEIARIRTKLKPVIDKYSQQVGSDFAKQVFSEIEKIRK